MDGIDRQHFTSYLYLHPTLALDREEEESLYKTYSYNLRLEITAPLPHSPLQPTTNPSLSLRSTLVELCLAIQPPHCNNIYLLLTYFQITTREPDLDRPATTLFTPTPFRSPKGKDER